MTVTPIPYHREKDMTEAPLAVKPDPRMNPITLRILDLIGDGEWHDQETILQQAMYTVPPGEAYRWAQARSKAVVERRSRDEIIASGQRGKTIQSIGSLVTNGRVERVGVNPKNRNDNASKKIRLAEDTPMVVYVCRSKDGDLSVHPNNTNGVNIAVHVIDAQVATDDPAGELATLKSLYAAIPNRIADRGRLQEVCRELMNTLAVRSTFKDVQANHVSNDRSEV